MMRSILLALTLMCAAASVAAQQPDSSARSDSLLKAQRDSSTARELGRIRAEPHNHAMGPRSIERRDTDSSHHQSTDQTPALTVVGDFLGDLSPDGSTQSDESRFGMREVALMAEGDIGDRFRADVMLSAHDAEGIMVHQAYLTINAYPAQVEGRVGRFMMPIGQQNATHRFDLHTIEYPWAAQQFLGAEGLTGTGVQLKSTFSIAGMRQELIGAAVDELSTGETHTAGHHHAASEGTLITDAPANRSLSGLGYALRLRNLASLTPTTTLEAGSSIATGKKAYPLTCVNDAGTVLPFCPGGITGSNERESIAGLDLKIAHGASAERVRGHFILQAEYFRQTNPGTVVRIFSDARGVLTSPPPGVNGAYVFGRYQLSRSLFVGSRVDAIGAELFRNNFSAASAYLEFFPSEVAKFVAGFERLMPAQDEATNRLLVQATFALGAHRLQIF